MTTVTGRWSDFEGEAFIGTRDELNRHNAKLRKRASRAKAAPTLELPLPQGTGEALYRVANAAGYEDPRELVSRLIHNADEALKNGDSHTFQAFTKVTVTIGNLDKWLPLVGVPVEDEDEEQND